MWAFSNVQRTVVTIALGVAGFLGAVSAPALAASHDAAAAQRNVSQRARPAYDPLGVRAGGFLVFPTVEMGVASDDNIYRSSEQETTDGIRSIGPRLLGVSQWRNHELELDVGANASFFDEAEEEDATNWFASLGGRLDVSRVAWIRANVVARELREERGDPNSPGTAARPVLREMLSARIEAFRRVNRLAFGVEGHYEDIAHEDSVDAETGRTLIQNDRNRGEGEGSARLGWELAPGYEAYLRGTRYVRRYDRLQGQDRYDRDSDGTAVVAGVRLDVGAVLYTDVFAGYRKQSYDEDERLPTAEGVTYGGTLTWNITPLTTIRSGARRTVDESTLGRASGYVASALELTVDHQLRHNLLIGARLGLTANRYEGIAREDDIVRGRVWATWLINRVLRAELGYRHQQRSSNVDGDDYAKNRISLNVRVSL